MQSAISTGQRSRRTLKIRAFCIYIHFRPDGSPFYVGKATLYVGQIASRPYMFKHRNPIHKRIVAKHGAENIDVFVVEFATAAEAFAAEIAHIARFKRAGHVLANLTVGGGGMNGYMPSDETRRKWSEVRKGRKASPETRALLSAMRTGKKLKYAKRPWQISVASKRFKGVPKSAEHRAKISAGHMGKNQAPASEQTKAKMSASHKARYAAMWASQAIH